MSVDGTHCRIKDPRKDPDKNLYSHKHNKACLSYEVALDLFEPKIRWVSGPHKGGESDLIIFRKALKDKIPKNKKAIADSAYAAEHEKVAVRNKHDTEEVKEFKRRACARQEKLNGFLKSYGVLSDKFRHPNLMEQHQIAFEAVCVLVQYSLEVNDVTLFSV